MGIGSRRIQTFILIPALLPLGLFSTRSAPPELGQAIVRWDRSSCDRRLSLRHDRPRPPTDPWLQGALIVARSTWLWPWVCLWLRTGISVKTLIFC